MVPNEHVMAESTYVPVQETQQDPSKQFFILKFQSELLAAYQYNIRLKYTGRLQDNMEGFYKSSYTVGNTTTARYDSIDVPRVLS